MLILVSLVLGAVRLRRSAGMRPAALATPGSWVLSILLLAAYLVAVWAMTAKPDQVVAVIVHPAARSVSETITRSAELERGGDVVADFDRQRLAEDALVSEGPR